MSPVGLTFKKSQDKFAYQNPGELMLVHCCTQCGHLSINRIAADDDPKQLLAVYEQQSPDKYHIKKLCREKGISLLKCTERPLLHARLFGDYSVEVTSHHLMG
jgi:hypothetical protein